LSKFLVRYRQTIKDGTVPETFGTSQAFDATYVAAFGLAATRNADLVGSDVTAGLKRLLAGATSVPIDISTDGVTAGLDAIAKANVIAFRGTSGSLAFDTKKGDVISDVQVWCVLRNPSTKELVFQASGLSYASEKGQMAGSLSSACLN
jgi:hypothetical protein